MLHLTKKKNALLVAKVDPKKMKIIRYQEINPDSKALIFHCMEDKRSNIASNFPIKPNKKNLLLIYFPFSFAAFSWKPSGRQHQQSNNNHLHNCGKAKLNEKNPDKKTYLQIEEPPAEKNQSSPRRRFFWLRWVFSVCLFYICIFER